jgi:effector-binding domain-containing protein
MSHQCKLKDQSTQKALSIRTRTAVEKLSQVFGEGYGRIAHYLGELGEHPIGPPFAAYYNMDMADLDVELGFPVARELPGRGEIKAAEIPGGQVASCLYTGPYEGIETAYNALTQWMEENGYQATGVAYEFYLNDPNETPPAELQTEINFPLKSS